MKKILIKQILSNITIIMIFVLIFIILLMKSNNIFSFIVIMIPLTLEIYTTIKYARKKIKYINNFNKDELLEIENAIQNPIFDGFDYVLTDKFIFNKKTIELIKYLDIYLIKKDWSVSLGKHSEFYNCIYIVTNNGNYCLKTYQANFINSEKNFKKDLDEFLISKNEKILIDDTDKNKAVLKEKYNINLKNNWKLKSKRNR